VRERQPAERRGLKGGDVIVDLPARNREHLRTTPTRWTPRNRQPVEIVVLRDDRRLALKPRRGAEVI